jgi:hypothetical protein
MARLLSGPASDGCLSSDWKAAEASERMSRSPVPIKSILIQAIDPLKITLNGYFYAKYKVFFWSGEYQWPDGDESVWQVYPKKVANLNSSEGEEMSDVISDYSNYSLDSRDYLDGASDDFVSLNSGDTEAYEMKNVYPQAEPKMVRLSDGRILCVWTGDNGDKNNKTNYTRVMYAIRSTDGVWTYGGVMDPTDDKAEFCAECCRIRRQMLHFLETRLPEGI